MTSPKGYAVALTLINDVSDAWKIINKEQLSSMSTFIQKLIKSSTINNVLNDELVEKILKFSTRPQYLQLLKDSTQELINQGVDLDKMSNQELNTIFVGKFANILVRELLDWRVLPWDSENINK